MKYEKGGGKARLNFRPFYFFQINDKLKYLLNIIGIYKELEMNKIKRENLYF